MNLHIIAFNVPYPADYGGVIDVFEKIKALHALGVRIHLHCFTDAGRGRAPQLEPYCESIHYYRRKTGIWNMFGRMPYIISSRRDPKLLYNLELDNHPILAEGLHCTAYFMKLRWPDRTIAIRLHNIESRYYRNLSFSTGSLFKKIYFFFESVKLARYEIGISARPYIFLTIRESERDYFSALNQANNVKYLPAFIPFNTIRSLTGTGAYNLYHGDLSVPDNERSLIWILRYIWDKDQKPLIIAGRQPSSRLVHLIRSYENVQLVTDPDEEQMEVLIREAHVHIIHSFNTAGIKIKLLHALFSGRHCIVSESLLPSEAWKGICRIARSAADFKRLLYELNLVPFTESDRLDRSKLLDKEFNSRSNAGKLIGYLQNPPNS